ncbi:MAG: hypothetical protein QXR42_07325 [Candidatus Bathyarchaeia archaeon]
MVYGMEEFGLAEVLTHVEVTLPKERHSSELKVLVLTKSDTSIYQIFIFRLSLKA